MRPEHGLSVELLTDIMVRTILGIDNRINIGHGSYGTSLKR